VCAHACAPPPLSLTISDLMNSYIKTQFKFLNELITFICLHFFLWNITWFCFQSTYEQTPHLNTKLVTLNTIIMQESCIKCCMIFEVFTASHIYCNFMVLHHVQQIKLFQPSGETTALTLMKAAIWPSKHWFIFF
jgi:hypothetical protein